MANVFEGKQTRGVRVSKLEPLVIDILERAGKQGRTIDQILQTLRAGGFAFAPSSVGATCMRLVDDRIVSRAWAWYSPAEEGKRGVNAMQRTRRHMYYLPQYAPPTASFA